ncbi:MAG: hypothetical protein PWR27_691 [Petroclostridium sp.]|nr:hypothetical protein [Petroclostridium sp.]
MQLYAHAASIVMSRGKIDEGLKIGKAIEVQPLRVQNYQQKADVYFQIGVNNLNAKKYDEAEKAFKEVLNIPVVMKEINKKILKPISLTSEVMEYIERSDYLLKNYRDTEAIKKFNRLVFHSSINIEVNNDGLPDTWHMWNPKGSEVKSKITDQGILRFENSGLNRGGLITRKFTLQSEKKYILEIKLKAELNNQKDFDIYVFSTKGTTTQLKVQSLALENIYKMCTFNFITTKDLDNSQQYVRLDHKGQEAGYIEISEINIYLQE